MKDRRRVKPAATSRSQISMSGRLSSTCLISRDVRFEPNGTPWTSQREPDLRQRVLDAYRRLCESGEEGRQLVALHQEIVASLDAMIQQSEAGKALSQPREQ